MNIVFAGTPIFAAEQLKALLDAKHPIRAVYTQPDKPFGRGLKQAPSPVKQLALSYNLAVEQPITLKTSDAAAQLEAYQPDVMLVVAYGLLLPKSILQIPKYGCINVHFSLLPAWRGASPVQQAILKGDQTTGITFMRMDEGLDTGDILWQEPLAIAENDTTESLMQKLSTLSANLISNQFEDLVKKSKAIPQDSSIATYAPKIEKKQALLNWQNDAFSLERQIRAYNPWPVAFFKHGSDPIKVYRAKAHNTQTHTQPPGTITQVTKQSVFVACGQNMLEILEIQLPGKKRVSVESALGTQNTFLTLGRVL